MTKTLQVKLFNYSGIWISWGEVTSRVIIIIKNYTGDIINFESAAAYANAKGIKVKTLIVNDDIAFIDEDPSR